MSEVLRREVFFSTYGNGAIAFHDWAMATTSIGTMAEPFLVNQRPYGLGGAFLTYDNDDSCSRIDTMHQIEPNRYRQILSGNQEVILHGGLQTPRA